MLLILYLKNKAQQTTMHTLALTLSIICSALLIVYLLKALFGRKEPEQTITITGRIVTKKVTFSEPVDVSGRTIEQR